MLGLFWYGKYKTTCNGIKPKMYRTWHNMLLRCYSDQYLSKNKTYIGCSVCDSWLNYQNFAEWYIKNNPRDKYHLDKDIIIDGNKIYSPSTCKFVSAQLNAEKASAKTYKFVSPDGEVIEIYNLAQFCKACGLGSGEMCWLNKGKRKSHKGWTRLGGNN